MSNINKDLKRKKDFYEDYLDAVHNIITVRECYSNACGNHLANKLKLERDMQVANVNSDTNPLPHFENDNKEESNLLETLNTIISNRETIGNQIKAMNEKVSNLSEVLDCVNNQESTNDIKVLKEIISKDSK